MRTPLDWLLLVILLAVLGFLAGMVGYEVNQTNACEARGGYPVRVSGRRGEVCARLEVIAP